MTRSPIEETFRVFENPYNLATITPPWLRFRIVKPDIQMARGSLINYTISWNGVRMKWRSEVTEYDPPRSFVDEQVKGPYKFWRHMHTLRETPEGTLVADEVHYVLPLGLLGRLAHGLVVKRQLLEIFQYRQEALGAILGQIVRLKKPCVERAQVHATRPTPPGETASPEAHKHEARS